MVGVGMIQMTLSQKCLQNQNVESTDDSDVTSL